ncbi:MAG: hypothetical protein D4S02_04165 [Rhodocyclaceae bacterium]|nr:MAG: hypothetical protein D4S02_04165 [Rhodocyclaceae bacterium]
MKPRGLLLGLLLAAAAAVQAAANGPESSFSVDEIRQILRHGPWPPAVSGDPSNRVAGNRDAVELGRALFFDVRLSADNTMACVTCHSPEHALSDGRDRARGRVRLDRNTVGLWNVAMAHWFGWDGAADSPWAFVIRPILNPDEMAATPRHVAAFMQGDATLVCLYRKAFGSRPRNDPERVLVDVAKALAAYLGTLISGKSDFDLLFDALSRGDAAAAAKYPADARRGLALFFGRGQCHVCHFGPNFSNGEFHDIGIPYLVESGRVDPGRHGGIHQVKRDRFNRLGEFSDELAGSSGDHTRHVAQNHATYGQFKVPSLRNVELTPPYMHNGSLQTLRDVVRHYSELPVERLHQDGEALLKPLNLSEADIDSLVAFLRTLTSRQFPQMDRLSPTCK